MVIKNKNQRGPIELQQSLQKSEHEIRLKMNKAYPWSSRTMNTCYYPQQIMGVCQKLMDPSRTAIYGHVVYFAKNRSNLLVMSGLPILNSYFMIISTHLEPLGNRLC